MLAFYLIAAIALAFVAWATATPNGHTITYSPDAATANTITVKATVNDWIDWLDTRRASLIDTNPLGSRLATVSRWVDSLPIGSPATLPRLASVVASRKLMRAELKASVTLSAWQRAAKRKQGCYFAGTLTRSVVHAEIRASGRARRAHRDLRAVRLECVEA